MNREGSKATICYSADIFIKCIYYDINLNSFYDIMMLNSEFCNVKYYGFSIYYFSKTNEYLMTCITPDKSTFFYETKRILYFYYGF